MARSAVCFSENALDWIEQLQIPHAYSWTIYEDHHALQRTDTASQEDKAHKQQFSQLLNTSEPSAKDVKCLF